MITTAKNTPNISLIVVGGGCCIAGISVSVILSLLVLLSCFVCVVIRVIVVVGGCGLVTVVNV